MDFSTTKVQQEKSLAIANIVQSKNIPTPNIIIPKPVPEKTQLLSIDLTGLNLPAGTKITLQRKIIRSNRTIFEDNISLVESNNNLT